MVPGCFIRETEKKARQNCTLSDVDRAKPSPDQCLHGQLLGVRSFVCFHFLLFYVIFKKFHKLHGIFTFSCPTLKSSVLSVLEVGPVAFPGLFMY